VDELLLVMARAPIAGQCKTRLAPTLGAERARQLYEAMLRDVVATARPLPVPLRLCVDGEHPIFAELGVETWPQPAGGLAARLTALLARGLGEAQAVCVIGSDAPLVSAHDLELAFELLVSHDAVIGPALDGGFWLLGLSDATRLPGLFDGVRLSTAHAFADLAAKLPGAIALPTHFDVDTPADVTRLEAALGATPIIAPHSRACFSDLLA